MDATDIVYFNSWRQAKLLWAQLQKCLLSFFTFTLVARGYLDKALM